MEVIACGSLAALEKFQSVALWQRRHPHCGTAMAFIAYARELVS
jgi:hypothetical protein